MEPCRGDLCFFYFAAKHRVAHVGIVVKPIGSGFWSVEGNTGSDGAGAVNREGDGVYRKLRRPRSLGVHGGFVRLPF
jgi:cell wall-associated NlpC family hydrolase